MNDNVQVTATKHKNKVSNTGAGGWELDLPYSESNTTEQHHVNANTKALMALKQTFINGNDIYQIIDVYALSNSSLSKKNAVCNSDILKT